jgi:ribonuclease HI
MNLKEVTIFTDGGAIPNPGRGGYGVVLRFGEHCKELSGGYNLTTNNRMELMAVIVGLEALTAKCRVKLHSDSKYIVDAINNGSALRWRANEWRMRKGKSKKAKNPDLWERLLSAYDEHEVEFVWVKGHAGIQDNERCDQLAEAAMQDPNLIDDEGYEPSEFAPTSNPSGVTSTTPGRPLSPKVKIKEEGQPCRKCNTPVVKRTPKKKKTKPDQSYYYAWYLHCPSCKCMYMVDEAKRDVTETGERLFDD